MKNATVDFKTAKDYHIGTIFRLNHVNGDHEWRVVAIRNSGLCWVDYYFNDELMSKGNGYDHNVSWFKNYEVVLPKSQNFNSLYEKLQGG